MGAALADGRRDPIARSGPSARTRITRPMAAVGQVDRRSHEDAQTDRHGEYGVAIGCFVVEPGLQRHAHGESRAQADQRPEQEAVATPRFTSVVTAGQAFGLLAPRCAGLKPCPTRATRRQRNRGVGSEIVLDHQLDHPVAASDVDLAEVVERVLSERVPAGRVADAVDVPAGAVGHLVHAAVARGVEGEIDVGVAQGDGARGRVGVLKMLKKPARNCSLCDLPMAMFLKSVRSWVVRHGARRSYGGRRLPLVPNAGTCTQPMSRSLSPTLGPFSLGSQVNSGDRALLLAALTMVTS
jgi:hypothetical protein